MATKLANEKEGSSQTKRSLDGWKFPKIPVDHVYKKKIFTKFPSYVVKVFEKTITLRAASQNISARLLSRDFLKDFIKKQHEFLHLGLVQIAIKPLLRDGLEAPINVCLRDARHLDFHNSLLALVEANLSQGPFYFNCFPSFSVSLADASSFEALVLNVKSGGIPLALTYRVVCKAMVDLSPKALNEPALGETTYFQPATGTCSTTKWDEFELQVPESPTHKQDPKAGNGGSIQPKLPDGHVLQKGRSMTIKLASEEEGSSQIITNRDDWKYPKIPIHEVYSSSNNTIINSEFLVGPSLWSQAKKLLRIFPNFAVKDFEKSITLKANTRNVSLKLLHGLFKKQNRYLHLGLVQIAIKPLLNDGLHLEAPIVVCLRDARILRFENSRLALVESNVSQGPFYFNCFPGYSVSLDDGVSLTEEVLTLNVMTSGLPLALTYRVVCKVTAGITLDLTKQARGETTYFQPSSGTLSTTKWDEVQVPESWTFM